MMITTSELDDGSIQILRDYIDELLLCVFPPLHANSFNQLMGDIGTWNAKGKTYSFQNIKAEIHRVYVLQSHRMCPACALPTGD